MEDRFDDSQLLAATGLSLVHVRRLITWGAVTPIEGGKGVVRQWERSAVRHIACVKALFDAGLSLPMAHTILSLLPTYFSIRMVDPETIRNPKVQAHWFDPKLAMPISSPAGQRACANAAVEATAVPAIIASASTVLNMTLLLG